VSRVLAGVDVGASGSRLRVLAHDGTTREAVSAVGAVVSDGVSGITRLAEALAATLESRLGPGESLDVVAIGTAALLALGDAADALPPLLAGRLGVRRVLLASDAITSYLGALGTGAAAEPEPGESGVPAGAVVAAGTGAIAMGYDPATGWRRADGWGYLLGDEGSAAWVGMAGVRAALRAFDGRPGGSAKLLHGLEAHFGPPDAVPSVVYPYSDRAARVAAFAPRVAAAARDGDEVAAGIWREAGRRIGEAAAAALPPVGMSGLEVSWVGGLFEVGELLLAPFRETVARLRPDARPRPPLGTSLDGAVALARFVARGDDSPVHAPWARDYVL
jgi:N-acetylglucosamine kinase-like BadF-type ATPase